MSCFAAGSLWCLRFPAARGVDPVPYPCRRYPGGTGGEILGQGAGAGAETVRHLA